MSRLAELIEELCPDGVEFRRLDELFATRNGYTPSRSDMSAWDSHDIPWFRMEDIRENGGILDSALTYVCLVRQKVLVSENLRLYDFCNHWCACINYSSSFVKSKVHVSSVER